MSADGTFALILLRSSSGELNFKQLVAMFYRFVLLNGWVQGNVLQITRLRTTPEAPSVTVKLWKKPWKGTEYHFWSQHRKARWLFSIFRLPLSYQSFLSPFFMSYKAIQGAFESCDIILTKFDFRTYVRTGWLFLGSVVISQKSPTNTVLVFIRKNSHCIQGLFV